jgi:putative membrane protein
MEPNPGPSAPRLAIAGLSAAVLGAITLVLWPSPDHTGAHAPGVIPSVNAALNATSAALLVAGFVFVRRGQVVAHRACMLTALGLSALFLVGYLFHHARTGSVPFGGTGALRALYFAILVPHIVLSAVVLPLALTTIWHGWHLNVPAHRRIARWTLPLWLYVSVSGVTVYWMLYRLTP